MGQLTSKRKGKVQEPEECPFPRVPEEEPPQGPSAEELRLNHLKRTKIVQEIVDTEKTYVAAMVQLVEEWERPLTELSKTKSPVLPLKDIQAIFSIAEGTFEDLQC